MVSINKEDAVLNIYKSTAKSNSIPDEVKDRIKAGYNQKAIDTSLDNAEYNVKGAENSAASVDGGDEAKMGFGETLLAVLSTVVSGAVEISNNLGSKSSNNNGKTAEPGTTKSSSALDKAVADYQKDSSAKNKRTLEMNLDSATFDKGTIDHQISKMTNQEAALKQAANGDFDPIIDNIEKGINDTQATIVEKNEQVEIFNKGIESVTSQIKGNREATIKTNELSEEAKNICDIQSEVVTVKLTAEAKEKDTLDSVKATVEEYNTKVTDDESAISTCTDKLSTTQNELASKTNNYASLKSQLDTTDKEIDKDGKKVKNPDYDTLKQAVKEAEKALKEAKNNFEKAQKELTKAKEKKDKDYAKLMEYASLVQIGENNLADIIRARNTAQNERDRAKMEQQDYVAQAITLGAKDEAFNSQLSDLKEAQTTTEQEKSNATINLSSMKQELKNEEKSAAAAKKVAETQLQENKDALSDLRMSSSKLSTSIDAANKALNTSATTTEDQKKPATEKPEIPAAGSATPTAKSENSDNIWFSPLAENVDTKNNEKQSESYLNFWSTTQNEEPTENNDVEIPYRPAGDDQSNQNEGPTRKYTWK